MTEPRTGRRMAAIVAADVVGYTRLMEQDEAGTLVALKSRRRNVVEPIVARNQGRIFKVNGDGVLVEFASAVNAVQCAIEIQRAMADANSDTSEHRHIVLRIGINLGDVMIDGRDLYGEGVNVAARLESIAEPGGILVSGSAHEFARNKVQARFEDCGIRSLKNVAEPVQTYRVLDVPEVAVASIAPPAERPSVAVLPFANKSDDPGQEYFADGITEDITTGLSRFRSLLVISPQSIFTYKTRAATLRTMGRELGVHFLVEGSVRCSGERVRVTVQLIEAESGKHLWDERYDRPMQDIFAVQDEVVQSIVSNVAGRLDDAGSERALRKHPRTLSVYDLLLQGRHFLNRGSKDDILRARDLFERAIAAEPDNAQAYVGLATTYARETNAFWSAAPREAARKAFEVAQKAVDLDISDSEAHLALAWGYFRSNSNFDLAASQVENAIKINPNDCHNYCFKGWLLTCAGETDSSIACANEALRRNPLQRNDCLYTVAVADYFAGRYDHALTVFSQVSLSMYPEVHAFMAACYAEVGRDDDATREAEEFLRCADLMEHGSPARDGDSWRAFWTRYMPIKNAAQFEMLLESFRKAGLPARG